MDIIVLQKNYGVVALLAILTLLITFIMNLVLSQEDEYKSYIKTLVISCIVSSVVVYIHTLEVTIESINLDPVPF